ncbi:hypothetical protein ACP70R_007851 [Stipagrostis hirtigluma subsp. patula]
MAKEQMKLAIVKLEQIFIQQRESRRKVPFLLQREFGCWSPKYSRQETDIEAEDSCTWHQQEMDKEQMKMAILKQEQIFRQQVHELHRLYHVQKQLMQLTPATAPTRAPAVVDAKPKPQLLRSEKATNIQQLISFSSRATPASAPAPAEDCNLELTLATGSSTSSSSDDERQKLKRVKLSSNSDSGTTAVSSTSTESELALFGEADVATTTAPVRFQIEGKRIDEMGRGAWMHQQCLSLKIA